MAPLGSKLHWARPDQNPGSAPGNPYITELPISPVVENDVWFPDQVVSNADLVDVLVVCRIPGQPGVVPYLQRRAVRFGETPKPVSPKHDNGFAKRTGTGETETPFCIAKTRDGFAKLVLWFGFPSRQESL